MRHPDPPQKGAGRRRLRPGWDRDCWGQQDLRRELPALPLVFQNPRNRSHHFAARAEPRRLVVGQMLTNRQEQLVRPKARIGCPGRARERETKFSSPPLTPPTPMATSVPALMAGHAQGRTTLRRGSVTGASRVVSVHHHRATTGQFSQVHCVARLDPRRLRWPSFYQGVMHAKQ
jgi:hypothetical protein